MWPRPRLFCPPHFTLCVKFNLFDILVKFCDDGSIGCQEIRWNIVHCFKLEVLPKKWFWGFKKGTLTLGTCPSNLVFVITCVTHVPNLRKIGQKSWSLSWTKCLSGQRDRHTGIHSSDFISVNAMNCIGQTISTNVNVNVNTYSSLLIARPYCSARPILKYWLHIKSLKIRFDTVFLYDDKILVHVNWSQLRSKCPWSLSLV